MLKQTWRSIERNAAPVISALAGRPAMAVMAAALLNACTVVNPRIPVPLLSPPAADATADDRALNKLGRELKVLPAPKPPAAAAAASNGAGDVRTLGGAGGEVIAAINLQQVALPAFVQIVYAEILKKTVNLHPAVSSRQDLVTFRTGGGQTAEQLEIAMRLLLKSYGISAIDVGGLIRVVPDNANLGDLPSIRYGAAMPDVPLPLRPVFNLVQLEAVRQTDVSNWLRTMFGDRVTVQDDAGRNAVLISGNPDNVKAALEAIAILDQPAMKGRASMALSPAYWSADEMARRLAELLSAEGYAVHPVGQPITAGGVRFPVILLPISALNSVYVFATNDAVLGHVTNWARTLDRPNERGIGKNFFSYAVKNKDADLLAQTLDRILAGSRSATAGVAVAPAQSQAVAATRLTAVVVDKSTNTLIFQVNPDEYGAIISLLQTLDRPTKAALIEVTVAELSLTNDAQLGVEWLSSQVDSAGRTSTAGTQGGLSLGTAGFNYRVFNGAGQLRVALNALASNNRATILSSPRVMARNGETATIQVGQEVPIITSQQSTGIATGTATQTGLLQTVQYRSTGVILKVKPVMHSGDQVDLDVSQEVSQALATETGVASSPTFTTRKVDTKLTLKNGTTVLLGGLISEDSASGSAGIPYLKDIPLVGSLFSKQSRSGGRRELIVLITPYVVNDSHDAETITDSFRKSLGSWAGVAQPVEKAAGNAVTRPGTASPPPANGSATGTAER